MWMQVPEQCGTVLPGPENHQLEDARLQSFWGVVVNKRVPGAPGIVLCVLFDRPLNRIPTLGMVALPWECEASTDEPVAGAGHAFTEMLWVPLGARKDWKGEGLLYSEGNGDTRKCWTWGRS